MNKHRQVLHAIFEYARRDDAFGLRDNPVRRTEKRPEGGPRPIETFDPEEVHAIARAARDGLHRPRPSHDYSPETVAEWQRVNEQDAALFLVAAFTGLRLGELLALHWSDVDFAGARLTVARAMSAGEEASTTKSRRFRVVPLADQAAAELDPLSQRHNFSDRDDFVFCRRRRTTRPHDRAKALSPRAARRRRQGPPLPRSPPHVWEPRDPPPRQRHRPSDDGPLAPDDHRALPPREAADRRRCSTQQRVCHRGRSNRGPGYDGRVAQAVNSRSEAERRRAAERMRGLFADVAPERMLADELIAERRAEARAEDRATETPKRHRGG